MTCIVGLVDQGTVYMGGDSAVAVGWDLTARARSKVVINGPILLGTSGGARFGDLLRYALVVPALDGDVERWVATQCMDAIRACLKDGGYAKKENEQESSAGMCLIGVAGRLFMIGSDYSVIEGRVPYAAIGCGDSFARGAMWATTGLSLSPTDRLTRALEAAEAFNIGVRGPFTILQLPPAIESETAI